MADEKMDSPATGAALDGNADLPSSSSAPEAGLPTEQGQRSQPGFPPPGSAAGAADVVAPGPQAASAVTPREAPSVAPTVLTPAQHALLAAILNRIIPARDGLPGAGDFDIASVIDRTLAASASLRRLFLDGLTAIDLEAVQTLNPQATASFVDLAAERQDAVLRAVERALPAFFAALVDHTYRGYYVLPPVHRAIGYDSRPPQPLGHSLPPFDPAVLDVQRRRAPFWRRVP